MVLHLFFETSRITTRFYSAQVQKKGHQRRHIFIWIEHFIGFLFSTGQSYHSNVGALSCSSPHFYAILRQHLGSCVWSFSAALLVLPSDMDYAIIQWEVVDAALTKRKPVKDFKTLVPKASVQFPFYFKTHCLTLEASRMFIVESADDDRWWGRFASKGH